MAALLLAIALCISASLSPCTLAAAGGGKPLVTAVTKDPATLLYTSPLKDKHPLVLDLAGPLIWTTTCDASHPTFECHHHECAHAHRYHPPSCPHSGYGKADDEDRFRCKCTAHPHNPFSGETETDDLTRTTLSANATDGKNPLYPVSFPAVTSCAPKSLLAKLPAGAIGVAGLANSRLSLPAQVSRTQKVPKKLLLCLPRSGVREGDGVAIFGGGPFFTLTSVVGGESGPDLTLDLTYTNLAAKPHNPAYYLPVKAIAVGKSLVPLPADALTSTGGGVAFSTRAPYTSLRHDVYRPFVNALDAASGWKDFKVPAVKPFELCYNSSFLPNTRVGHLAPDIDFVLPDGKNYTIGSLDSMIDLDDFRVACFAFVEMKAHKTGAPAVEIGGFQMENNVLQFDLDKMQLGFARVPIFMACSNFNFTLAGHY
ncbi:hypothetical protein QOZ80_1AG0045990 [Eleusine coracana subsp. coracana]|nr:hypothetical protein QOZ80_1AG0045990 [Eleusine coracana subsp. coracana]